MTILKKRQIHCQTAVEEDENTFVAFSSLSSFCSDPLYIIFVRSFPSSKRIRNYLLFLILRREERLSMIHGGWHKEVFQRERIDVSVTLPIAGQWGSGGEGGEKPKAYADRSAVVRLKSNPVVTSLCDQSGRMRSSKNCDSESENVLSAGK